MKRNRLSPYSRKKKLEVSYGTVYIPDNAFRGYRKVEKVVIPKTVKRIGKYAFSECYKLKTIVFKGEIETINDGAFSWCLSLERVVIPDGVKIIGDSCFSRCENLREVIFPDSICIIGSHAFFYDNNLEKVKLPGGVKKIGDEAFYSCQKLDTITFPESLEELGSGVLMYCSNLKDINFECKQLKRLDKGFICLNNVVEKLVIPNGVEVIKKWFLYNCYNLKEVVFPKTLIEVEDEVLSTIPKIEKITIPKKFENQIDKLFKIDHEIKIIYI